MLQKRDYRLVETKDRTEIQSELDKAGPDGWELAAIASKATTAKKAFVIVTAVLLQMVRRRKGGVLCTYP